MSTEEFMLTLPSNASAKYFPENTPSCFKVALPKVLELEGEWEIAIVNIQYPYNWPNYLEDYIAIVASVKDDENGKKQFADYCEVYTAEIAKDPAAHEIFAKTIEYIKVFQTNEVAFKLIKIPTGFYKHPALVSRYLMSMFNKQEHGLPTKMKWKIEAFFDPIRNQFDFEATNINFFQIISTTPRVHRTLGLRPQKWNDKIFISGIHDNTEKPYMENLSTMYIYCDLIKYQIVGDTQAPLLAALAVQGDQGDQCFWGFNPPYYIPLNQNSFSSIQIKICTPFGEPFPFDPSGRVVLQMHLRRHRGRW